MSAKPIKFLISVAVAFALVAGAATAANALVIYVRVVADNCRSVPIDSQPSETVLDIKQKINLVENIAPSRQILTFAGRTLDDTQTLSDLNIQSQATFNLTVVALPCEVGTFSSSGNQPCDPAPIGRFVSVSGAMLAIPCEPGTYQNQTGQSSCINAVAGYFVDSAGASAQQACPTGYTSNARAIACTPVQAVLCSIGTFSSTGNTPCDPAAAGRFVSVTGARSATPCLPGTYQNQTGQSSCLQATPGYFVDVSGAVSQVPCPAGTTSLAAAVACVSEVAMPILFSPNSAKSLVVSGYSAAATNLTAAMKSKTKAFVSVNTSMTKLQCVGDVAGVAKSAAQVKLAASRAKSACAYAKSLNKKLSVTSSGKQSKTSGKISRSVLFTLVP